jgi:hypothetical protein
MVDDSKLEIIDELEEKEEEMPSFECYLKCSFLDSKGEVSEEFEGRCELYTNKLILYDGLNSPMDLKFEDIIDISGEDYQIRITLESEDKIILKELGYYFEDFLKQFVVLRNEFLAVHMLMEDIKIFDADGEYIYLEGNGNDGVCEECTARIYEKSLVILSAKRGPIRIPLSLISTISSEDYNLRIVTDYNEVFILKYLGENFDIFVEHLKAALGKLASNMQSLLNEIIPNANSLTIRRLCSLLKDGKAVNISEIEAISPKALDSIDKRIIASSSAASYEFLKSIIHRKNLQIGLKRGLLGGLNSDYIWMTAPVSSPEKASMENLIIMEAFAPSSEGRATYFFRVMPWPDFLSCDEATLYTRTNETLKILNRCMLSIDFRREPIYLSSSKFEAPENLKYKISLQRLPCLKTLRNLYFGRVIHSSEEQWTRDIKDLIEFASSSKDDSMKWKRVKK